MRIFEIRKLSGLLILCVLIPFAALAAPRTEYVEGDVIVTFKSGTGTPGARQSFALAPRPGQRVMKRFNALSIARQREIGVVRGQNKSTEELIQELSNDPQVERVEPNYLRWRSSQLPSGALFAQLWALRNTGQQVNGFPGMSGKDISYGQAWALGRLLTTNPPVVGIVDGGAYIVHPDLSGALWHNPGELPGNHVDDDGNGYVDDQFGYNFFDGNADVADLDGHGTHVAGTIGATDDNHRGMVGVSRNVRLMILRAAGVDGEFPTSTLLEAMDYALGMKARGVNVVALNGSFGGSGFSFAERDAIQALADAGIIFCAAAGNESNNNDVFAQYPASYPLENIIAVAASDQNDNLAGFSNYGAESVDIAAPGVNILSTFPPVVSAKVQAGTNTYEADPLEFSGSISALSRTLYDCGLGYPSNFPAAVSGNIALVRRGELFFSEKVLNAMDAGALAVIIYNNVPGTIGPSTLDHPRNWVPAVSISQEDGESLRARTPTTVNLSSGEDPENVYRLQEGTSMATPHVSAAVAIAALNYPDDNATQRVARVLAAVDPVPALIGKVKTRGRLNVSKIVDADQNSLGDWWELKSFDNRLDASASADPDGDGADNESEFIADTNPNDPTSYLRVSVGPRAVSWWSGTNSRVVLQKADTPSGPWLDVLTNAAPTLSSGIYLEPGRTNAAAFYRLNVERP
jgi:subtilisin family serine protease